MEEPASASGPLSKAASEMAAALRGRHFSHRQTPLYNQYQKYTALDAVGGGALESPGETEASSRALVLPNASLIKGF